MHGAKGAKPERTVDSCEQPETCCPIKEIFYRYDGPNVVFRFDEILQKYVNIAAKDTPFAALRDELGRTTSVCACDVDGDGKDEIYFHNENDIYVDQIIQPDRMFRWTNNSYVDVFTYDVNKPVAPRFGGHAVGCLDRRGTGQYGVLVMTYSEYGEGRIVLIEVDFSHPDNNLDTGSLILKNSAPEVGLNTDRDGRSVAVGPILSENGHTDIIIANAASYYRGSYYIRHSGNNTIFKNVDGMFEEMSADDTWDSCGDSRGVFLTDLNNDGKMDIGIVDWLGTHKLFIQNADDSSLKV
ncbi:hypothetical protein ScPMuIL_013669 [Solemya velum]